MFWRSRTWLVALVFLAVAPSSTRRVEIVRATAFAFDDEPITMQVRVEPHADNRALFVSAVDQAMIVRRSLEPLDGAKAPRTRWVTWRQLPAGQLLLVASVYDGTREVARHTRPIRILSRLSPEHEVRYTPPIVIRRSSSQSLSSLSLLRLSY